MHHLIQYLITMAENQAAFRREKAEEYPDDARRNLECAREFEKFARRLAEYEPGPAFEAYAALHERDDDRVHKIGELLDEEFRSIHFGCPEDLEQFFQDLVDRATEE